MADSARHSEMFNRRELFLLVAMALLVFASRLPWIFAGYGDRADSYRVVNAARHIAQTREYVYSRAPGYPVHEYLVATVANAGPAVANGISVVFSCVAFVFFALVLRRFQVPACLLLALAFVFTPIVYIDSTSTIDTMPGMAFVLVATYFALLRRPVVAGIFLGLAIGCRITLGAMLLPISLAILFDEQNIAPWKQVFELAACTLTVGGLCFLPVVWHYGPAFFVFADQGSYPRLAGVFNRGVLLVWGVPGAMALFGLCCAAPFCFDRIQARFVQTHAKVAFVYCASTILIYTLAYLRLPHQAAYMTPVVPSVLLLIGLIAPSKCSRGFAIVLLLSSFVVNITRSGVTLSGPVQCNHWSRLALVDNAEKIIKSVNRLPACVVVAGSWLPVIGEQTDFAQDNQHEYVYLIEDERTCEQYRRCGRQIVFVAEMDEYNLRIRGVDLKKHAARQLDIPDK